jgi:peptidylprolyl isomerase
VGTAKRERQKSARLEKTVAEAAAAKREKSKRTAIRIVLAAIVILVVLFGITTLMGNDSDDADDADDVETADTPVADTTLPELTEPEYTNPELAEEVLGREPPEPTPPPEDTPADTLEITTEIEGEGEGVEPGDIVTVHYVGVLADGEEFDQSWERGEPFTVPVGQGQVITGWDEGLVDATIGERRHLVIGSDNAYGDEGRPPTIPPAAPLAFTVDVVDIQPGG